MSVIPVTQTMAFCYSSPRKRICILYMERGAFSRKHVRREECLQVLERLAGRKKSQSFFPRTTVLQFKIRKDSSQNSLTFKIPSSLDIEDH